jgi:acyl-CoA reductase-like NAD-dependent aldehyde dehydrogenase
MIVSVSNSVIVDMSKRYLNQLRIPCVLIENGARYRAHTVVNQAVFKTHAFQSHVSGLAIAGGCEGPISREHVLTRALVVGDPHQWATDVGPMITEQVARRTEQLVNEALAEGVVVLCGHHRQVGSYAPTVLEHVRHSSTIRQQEVFAPVVILEPFEHLEDAIALANAIEYSLHAGLFTRDISKALKLARQIEAGGVMINDSSDYRFDTMPFGGFKYGNLGREGVRFAYEDMTQPKVVCISELD